MASLMILIAGVTSMGSLSQPQGDEPIHYRAEYIVIEVHDWNDVVDIEPGDLIVTDFWIDPTVPSPSFEIPKLGYAQYQPISEAESRIQIGNEIDIWTRSFYDTHKLTLFDAPAWSHLPDLLTYGVCDASAPLQNTFSDIDWSVELHGDLIDGIEIPETWRDDTLFNQVEFQATTQRQQFRVIGAPVPEPMTFWALFPFLFWYTRKRARSAHT